MRNILLVLFSVLTAHGYSQIVAPDTVCIGIPVNFSTPQWATTYAWDFNTLSVVQPISPANIFYSGTALNNPAYGVLNNDSGNYYFFTVNYGTEELIRFSFGNDIFNTPVTTDLGSLGLTGTDLDGIDIVKDSATNQWYGILADYSELAVLSFGTSLSNTPTSTITSFASPLLDWGHQTTIKRYNGNWVVFVANRHTNITRFDFGPTLTGVPVATSLPNLAGLNTPVAFSLYQQDSNWYMLINDLLDYTVIRYNFGTNLQNNSPTAVSLGNPGGLLNLPRPITLLNDCQNNLIAYIGDETGELIRLNFGGDITNTPVATDLGSTGISHFSTAVPTSYADSFGYICIDAISNNLRFFNPLVFSNPTHINYYNPNETYSFSTPGTYHVSLFCNMGYSSGPSVYCKDVVVTSGTGTASSRDTSICTIAPILLYPDTTGTQIWSTGDTTSSISVSASGTYWVTTTTGPCTYKSDTVHVSFSTLPVNLGDDTAFCVGHSLVLSPAEPAGSSFAWSTGTTGPSVSVTSSGTYWLTVTSGGCTGSDTIQVTVNPIPPVNLGPDTTICSGYPFTLQSSDTYTSPTYLWSTGSTAANITPTTTNTYWLEVTVAGCTGSDSVRIAFNPTPVVNIGDDTAFCLGDSLVLTNLLADGESQLWSSGSSGSSIIITTSGTYWLDVTNAGCTGRDTIHVAVNPIPIVNIGPDTTICQGTMLTLQSADLYTSPSYLWSTGSTSPAITASVTDPYWLDVTVAGCTGSDTMKLTVNPMPTLNLGNDTAICPGDSITVSPQTSSGVSYTWSTGSNAPAIEVKASGIYILTVTWNGCSVTDSVTISSITVPKIDLGPDTTLCTGTVYNLDAGNPTTSYTWSTGETSQAISITQSGTYWVVYKGVCGIVSDTVNADFELCDIWFPSAFTPNDDGLNDIFRAVGNLQLYTDFSLSIYNRWGQRIFYTSDIYDGWDGKFNGVKQDLGTYFYMAYYTLENKSHMIKGDIELIR